MPSLKGKLSRNGIQISLEGDNKKKYDPSKIIPFQYEEKSADFCDNTEVIDDTQREQGQGVNEELARFNKIRRTPESDKKKSKNKMVKLENSGAVSVDEEDLDQVRAKQMETVKGDAVLVKEKENSASGEMLTHECSKQGPSATSNAGDRFFNDDFQDSESDDKEFLDDVESDDMIFISDTDEHLDTSIEDGSKDNACHTDNINEDQTGRTPRCCADIHNVSRSSRGKKGNRKGGKRKNKGKRAKQKLVEGRKERAERRNSRKISAEGSTENAENQSGASKQAICFTRLFTKMKC